MRKVAITLAVTAAMVGAAFFAWEAEATTSTAAASIGAAAKDYSPVKKRRARRIRTPLPSGVPLGLQAGPMVVRPLLN
jgi:hypothetical protein